MAFLTEEVFTKIVDAGCEECRGKMASPPPLIVETFVAQTLPLMGGEPYGAPSWGYKGEDLVRGTYRISCDACKRELFSSSACSRCDSPDGVERARELESSFPLPTACSQCGSELVTATAYVPATVVYEGKRGAKARTQTTPDDPGFHAFRVECKQCRNRAELSKAGPCPLCAKPD